MKHTPIDLTVTFHPGHDAILVHPHTEPAQKWLSSLDSYKRGQFGNASAFLETMFPAIHMTASNAGLCVATNTKQT